jgi:cobalt-zinc-cadmium resistance protein CzcA
MGDLPTGITGGLAPITTPLGEMFMFTVEGPAMSLEERRSLLDWVIRPPLRTVPGVADVNAWAARCAASKWCPTRRPGRPVGLTLTSSRRAIEANNRNDGAGRLGEGEETLLVRAEGAIKTQDDLRAIVVKATGRQVRVGDVAEVRIGSLTRYGVVTHNGEGEAVQGLVLGLRGANARKVVEGVRREARRAQAQPCPKGVRSRPFYDRSELVGEGRGHGVQALIEAIVLVLVLLGPSSATCAPRSVALVLPLSALATFMLMARPGCRPT